MTPREKFQTTRRELSAALIERDTEVDICLTALAAGEHALLVGPPGTGKSLLSDAIVKWMDGSRFQILLTKFTTPEEVFGPVSLAGLKADRYRRVTTGKLPTADVAFVDEIFKASSAILNTLLTILNERTYDNDGERTACPLRLCVAASNEWPGSNGDGKELGAMFDRFILRRAVRPIATERGLSRLLWDKGLESLGPITRTMIGTETTGTEFTALPEELPTITPEELDEANAQAVATPWTAEAQEAFLQIIHEARTEGIQPGDRRLRKSVKVAQAYAWLQGHTQVERDDLEILAHTLWDDPTEQPAKLAQIVGKIANPAGMKINSLLIEAEQILAGIDLKNLATSGVSCKKLAEIRKKLVDVKSPKASAGAEYLAGEIRRVRLATVEAIEA